MSNIQDWSEYFGFTRLKPPYSLLVEAVKYVKEKNKAIDIGGGALRDTRYLLAQGFDVTVIDSSPLLIQEADRIKNIKLHPIVIPFERFDYPKNKYDIAISMFALNFCNPLHFDEVLKKIEDSIKTGGIFCALIFGNRDKWSSYTDKTYPSKDHMIKLLKDFEIISFNEKNSGEKDKNNEFMDSGHVLQIIAKK